jgi:hypothetical protein
MKEQFKKLWKAIKELSDEYGDNPLVQQLSVAVQELETAAEATVPIHKGGIHAGYGVNDAKKNIACEQVIAITREIKKMKGW